MANIINPSVHYIIFKTKKEGCDWQNKSTFILPKGPADLLNVTSITSNGGVKFSGLA